MAKDIWKQYKAFSSRFYLAMMREIVYSNLSGDIFQLYYRLTLQLVKMKSRFAVYYARGNFWLLAKKQNIFPNFTETFIQGIYVLKGYNIHCGYSTRLYPFFLVYKKPSPNWPIHVKGGITKSTVRCTWHTTYNGRRFMKHCTGLFVNQFQNN